MFSAELFHRLCFDWSSFNESLLCLLLLLLWWLIGNNWRMKFRYSHDSSGWKTAFICIFFLAIWISFLLGKLTFIKVPLTKEKNDKTPCYLWQMSSCGSRNLLKMKQASALLCQCGVHIKIKVSNTWTKPIPSHLFAFLLSCSASINTTQSHCRQHLSCCRHCWW